MTKDITYTGTSEVPLNLKGKPSESWMKNWTQEERFDKYFEFCRVFDERDDSLLREDYQIFSHRLHWHEHPFCALMRDSVKTPKDRLWLALVFSFSNEHWGTLTHLMTHGIEKTRAHFKEHRHARNDLFQIYYPKNTNVKDWLLDGPLRAATEMSHILNGKRKKPWTMMGFAKEMEAYFKRAQGFRSPLYPCKNAARYVAMSFPELVDPESVLFGGTGHFDGMQQVFGGQNLNGKVKYEVDTDGEWIPKNKQAVMWLDQMTQLCNHSANSMSEQKMLNHEDKTCFFFKHVSVKHGTKKPTKRIPYNWIFPDSFDLAKRADGIKVFPAAIVSEPSVYSFSE